MGADHLPRDCWYVKRKLAWLTRCGLAHHEEWPLFGVEKYISRENQVWVRITSLPSLEGHADGIRHTLNEVRRLENRLESEGIVGWLQAIRKGNWKMRNWTEMVGAELYAVTEEHWHFKKIADVANFPRSVRELVSRGGLHHGQA